MIFGDAVPVEDVTAYVDPSVDYSEEFKRIVATHDYENSELVVMTDVLGGSVNNEFMGLLGTYDFHLLTGLNLALLIEVAACPVESLAAELPHIVERAKEHIVLCTDLGTAPRRTKRKSFSNERSWKAIELDVSTIACCMVRSPSRGRRRSARTASWSPTTMLPRTASR